jgi:hypothetical protein
MILKLIYFFIIFITFEITVFSLVTNSFFKSLEKEYLEKKDFADSMGRLMALNFSRYLEKTDKSIDSEDLKSYFSRSVISSKSSSILINNIYFLSTDGTIISSYISSKDLSPSDTNIPIFTKALRMRRGQVELALYDAEKNESSGYFEKKILELIPDLSEKRIMISAPVYIQDKMEVCCSVHIIYERQDFEKFISIKKNQFREQFILIIISGLIFTLILWLVFYLFVYHLIKEKLTENSYESLLRKEVKKSNSPSNEEVNSSEQNKNSKSLDAVYLD